MSTTTHRTTVTADPDLPMVRIERTFDAAAHDVYRAHVDPELVVRWLAPHTYEMELDQWDCRTGGSWRFVHRGDGAEHWFRGCFHELRPDELLVQTFTYEGVPDGVALERLEFHDLGDGRTRLVATSLVDSFEGRDQFLASGMEEGIIECYERLDELLA